MTTENKLLTTKEVKALLNCSMPLVYKLVKTGRIPAVLIPQCEGAGKPRNTVRVRQGDLDEFIAKHYTPAT